MSAKIKLFRESFGLVRQVKLFKMVAMTQNRAKIRQVKEPKPIRTGKPSLLCTVISSSHVSWVSHIVIYGQEVVV